MQGSSAQPPPPVPPGRVRLLRVIAGLVVAAVLLLGLALYLSLRPAENNTQQASASSEIGGPFTLTDATGKQVTDQDFRGKYLLIYFGYTFCPDVCPTTLNEIAAALDKLGPKGDHIAPLFITVDPKRDTPPVIRQYVTAFSPRLIGLTGPQDQIATVEKEYRVYAAEHRTGPGPDDYSMDHSSIIYLMGPDGVSLPRSGQISPVTPWQQRSASTCADDAPTGTRNPAP
jgi:protein SCO1/2